MKLVSDNLPDGCTREDIDRQSVPDCVTACPGCSQLVPSGVDDGDLWERVQVSATRQHFVCNECAARMENG
jgi:hypothetical protein